MKKTLSLMLGTATVIASFAFALVLPAAAETGWDTTGNYDVALEYLGSDYQHNMSLTQAENGQLTGDGSSQAGNNTYLWTIHEGMVTGDAIAFTAHYTATPDAVNPQTIMNIMGTISPNGTMSGTWSDNYDGGNRAGTWMTTSGTANTYPVDESPYVAVTISKYIDGAMATAENADYADFPMTATWDAENIGAGTGSYTLSETNSNPYQAITADMTKGADYATQEVLTGGMVDASCTEDKPFALHGYTVGNTQAEALAATPSMTTPSFTNLQQDKYVIVWNKDCENTYGNSNGQINGEVVESGVELEVTSIQMIDTTATANGSFADGWKYIFHITAPSNEDNLAMKFSNWLQTGDNGTIPVAGNMRISSLQADNGGATILLTAANVYSTPDLHMTGDLDPVMPGRQVQITVEVAVPTGTPSGSYTTSYGVQSNP